MIKNEHFILRGGKKIAFLQQRGLSEKNSMCFIQSAENKCSADYNLQWNSQPHWGCEFSIGSSNSGPSGGTCEGAWLGLSQPGSLGCGWGGKAPPQGLLCRPLLEGASARPQDTFPIPWLLREARLVSRWSGERWSNLHSWMSIQSVIGPIYTALKNPQRLNQFCLETFQLLELSQVLGASTALASTWGHAGHTPRHPAVRSILMWEQGCCRNMKGKTPS